MPVDESLAWAEWLQGKKHEIGDWEIGDWRLESRSLQVATAKPSIQSPNLSIS
jgi:hypothetical protein